MDYINDLHELCETISREIAESNEKIRSAGGKLSSGDVDVIDKLTHALKSIKATIAMIEDEGDGEYSSRAYPDSMGGSFRTMPRYMRGGSYARGRNARRDSMGRYSSNGGYSRAGDLADQLHELMQDAPNEAVKRDIQRLIDKMEEM